MTRPKSSGDRFLKRVGFLLKFPSALLFIDAPREPGDQRVAPRDISSAMQKRHLLRAFAPTQFPTPGWGVQEAEKSRLIDQECSTRFLELNLPRFQDTQSSRKSANAQAIPYPCIDHSDWLLDGNGWIAQLPKAKAKATLRVETAAPGHVF